MNPKSHGKIMHQRRNPLVGKKEDQCNNGQNGNSMGNLWKIKTKWDFYGKSIFEIRLMPNVCEKLLLFGELVVLDVPSGVRQQIPVGQDDTLHRQQTKLEKNTESVGFTHVCSMATDGCSCSSKSVVLLPMSDAKPS